MPKTIIFSHIDCDGILSARLIARHFKTDKVFLMGSFQFGLEDWTAELVASESPDLVFILDLGTSNRNLELASIMSNFANEVVLLDHHPPEDPNKVSELATPKFRVVSTPDNCTAGLAYEYLKEFGFDVHDKFTMLWTAIGIHGDVATELPQAKAILEEIGRELPEVNWKVEHFSPSSGQAYEMSYFSHFTSYFNTPRRIAYDDGAMVAYKATEEIEDYGDIIILEDVLGVVSRREKLLEAKYPHTALIKYWVREWREYRKEVFSEQYMKNVSLPLFSIYFIDHPWDLGGYVASVKSKNKPAVTINYGVPHEKIALLHARNSSKVTVDLNKVMKRVEELTDGKIRGGGHMVAVGGAVDRDLDKREIIKAFNQAFNEQLTLA